MKKFKTEQELKDWIITMHKQNLSGREDFVEAFELGIDAALEELKDLEMISLEDAITKDIGAIGTPERDDFEREIKEELSYKCRRYNPDCFSGICSNCGKPHPL